MTAIGTPIFIPVVELCFGIGGCDDAELVGAKTELCDVVDARELVGLKEEMEVVVSVTVDSNEVTTVPDFLGLTIAEAGYGSSEVVKWVAQQSGPPKPCPGAPAQHQLLLFGSQRLTSVNPWN